MKARVLTIVIFCTILISSCNIEKSHDISVMTLNIRMDTPVDGKNAWPDRAGIVSGFIDKHEPDLMGLQEVLWHQYEYLDSALNGYSSIAVGRDDGLQKGEACPVFFRDDRFTALANGTFWLSETPDIPGSVGWGAALTRIATWVRLYDKKANDTILFLNTHFDHISDSARFMSAGILLENIRKLSGDNDFIITGDFNAQPNSLAISSMKEGNFAVDAFTVSLTRPEGLRYTFNGWQEGSGGGRIDYIFIRNGMKVISHYTWKVIENGVFISDHWPVTAKLTYSHK
jgi:endonuclease/exonuclease/phosphatase family metal-dependent hydrolase